MDMFTPERHANETIGEAFVDPLTHSQSPETSSLDKVSLYSDRCCSAEDTVSRLQPHLTKLGVTRLARQTGLDLIGIPTFSAFRPNALTLSVSQGKGIDDAAAKASALMEAVEFAIAECPEVSIQHTSIGSLLNRGLSVFGAERLLPMGTAIPMDIEIDWLEGFNFFTRQTTMVPADAVIIDATQDSLMGIAQTTNGLASGNNQEEAVFHALCEIIERDSTTLFSMRTSEWVEASRIDPRSFDDIMVDRLTNQVDEANLELALFDQTTNLGVPTIMATIAEKDRTSMRHFDLSAGYGCHPISSRAAIRAITEAAQTRITNIAGARDDFNPCEYRKALCSSLKPFANGSSSNYKQSPKGCDAGASLSELIQFVCTKLTDQQIEDVTVVPVGGQRYGISVVKVFAPQLEDQAPNPNWRPGARAAAVLMGLA